MGKGAAHGRGERFRRARRAHLRRSGIVSAVAPAANSLGHHDRLAADQAGELAQPAEHAVAGERAYLPAKLQRQLPRSTTSGVLGSTPGIAADTR